LQQWCPTKLTPLPFRQVTVLPVNGATKSVVAPSSQNDITVYPWHSLVPFLTTNVRTTNSVIEKKSDDEHPPSDGKDDGDGNGNGVDKKNDGGSHHVNSSSNSNSNSHRQDGRAPTGSNNNVEPKDAELVMTDDEVFDENDDFLLSPSPTTPSDSKGRRSKERIRRPMNAFMVKMIRRTTKP